MNRWVFTRLEDNRVSSLLIKDIVKENGEAFFCLFCFFDLQGGDHTD